MDHPLTVVLPIYNCERQIRSSLLDILDLVPIMPSPMELVVVDDGSTDETYETVCELARVYPQIRVLRQPVRMGLSAALDMVRNRMAVDRVVVHDGVSAISASQLRSLLQEDKANPEVSKSQTAMESQGSRRFASVRALHNSMEQVHRSVTSFRWVQLDRPLIPRRGPLVRQPMMPQDAPASPAPVYLANIPVGTTSIPLG